MVTLQPYTAGSPMNELIRWTNMSYTRISELLKGKGLNVGRYVVKNLMKQIGYVRRKMVKCKTMAQVAFRNEQFEYIKKLTWEFMANGLPVLSIEHKAFCHITRAWKGEVFDSFQTVEDLAIIKAKLMASESFFDNTTFFHSANSMLHKNPELFL